MLLVLPGGRAESLDPPPRLGLARLRMRVFAAAVRRRVGDAALTTAEVHYRHRGWNGPQAHPVADARAAVRELVAHAPDVRIVLLGHSMGGRAALAAADEPQVVGAVLLAPWCEPVDGAEHLRGRRIVVLHDPADRVTSARKSRAFATRAARAGADVRYLDVPRGGHAMLAGAGDWHRLAASAVTALLAAGPLPGAPPDAPAPGLTPG
ncbi:alpha/beta fold hydrolase [Kitasatospora sp. NPDC048538]|uniref:alpha/beta fold hydrolase n=1 Tax=unclassified Kitasatospora TaxID=2633591 RepID=UPI0033F0FFDF